MARCSLNFSRLLCLHTLESMRPEETAEIQAWPVEDSIKPAYAELDAPCINICLDK